MIGLKREQVTNEGQMFGKIKEPSNRMQNKGTELNGPKIRNQQRMFTIGDDRKVRTRKNNRQNRHKRVSEMEHDHRQDFQKDNTDNIY